MNIKLFLGIVLAAVLGISIPWVYRYYRVEKINKAFKAETLLYQREIPENSLNGTIIDIGGTAEFEGRYDTEFSPLEIGKTAGYGVDLRTGANDESFIKINFAELADLTVGSNTRLSFANTAADNFLITLNRGGKLNIETIKDNGEVSITGLHLLSQFTGATTKIEINDNLITIELSQGSVKLGYNDLKLVSQTSEISGPKKIIFNDTKRTIKLKKL